MKRIREIQEVEVSRLTTEKKGQAVDLSTEALHNMDTDPVSTTSDSNEREPVIVLQPATESANTRRWIPNLAFQKLANIGLFEKPLASGSRRIRWRCVSTYKLFSATFNSDR